jgi:anti-sigma factor RsiW
MADDDLACVELVELVNDYLEGLLPAEDRVRFEAHVAICEGCDNYLDQMRTTVRLAGRLAVDDLAPDARAELLEAFRGWRDDSPG